MHQSIHNRVGIKKALAAEIFVALVVAAFLLAPVSDRFESASTVLL